MKKNLSQDKTNKTNEDKISPKKIAIKNKFFNKFDLLFLSILIFTLSIYFLTYFEEISWQLSAIGRIILIKVLPYYDWRTLKNKQCLINSPFRETDAAVSSISNCNVCEDIIGIDAHEVLEEDILTERYINSDSPVILTKGLEDWPNNSNFIDELKKGDSSKSYPCNLSTNIYKGSGDLSTILSKLKFFDQFFIHFQNCELEAMRSLRKYTFLPDIIPSIHPPVLYNWLIWSKYYNMTNYKRIELVEKVTIFGQLFGSTHVRLIPRKNCESSCPFLDVTIHGGELLIFTSLWELEYRPAEIGENMAVVMEYRD